MTWITRCPEAEAARDAASAIAAEVRAARSDTFVGRRPTGTGTDGRQNDGAESRRPAAARRIGSPPTAHRSTRGARRAVAGPGAADFRLDARATERLESAGAGGLSRRRARSTGILQLGGFDDALLQPAVEATGWVGCRFGWWFVRRRRSAGFPFGAGPIDAKTRGDRREGAGGARRRTATPPSLDVRKLEHGLRLEFDENWNTAEFNAAPYVPGFGIPKPVEEEDGAMLDAHKDWLMRVGNIATDAQYEESKRIALQQFEHYKKMDEKEHVSRGASPFHGTLSRRENPCGAGGGHPG